MSVFGFHFHEHSSSNYCGNAYERGNQFDMPGTTGLTSLLKFSRITLDFAIGLQEIKRTVWKVSELLWSAFYRIRKSECGKIGTRVTPNRDTFYAMYVRIT